MKRMLAIALALLCCMPYALAGKYERIVESDKGPYQWALKDDYWYFCNENGDAFPGYRWSDEDFNWLNVDMYYDELPDGRIALCFGSTAEGLWGIIDAQGNIVAEPQYERLDDFANGNLLAVKDGKYGVIAPDGNTVVDFMYDSIHCYEGYELHKFELNGQWGFMDSVGNAVIEAQYDDVSGMDVWAAARVGDLWGMIDPQGNWIFEPQFEEYHSISREYALVTKNGKAGAAKPDGTMLLDPVYDSIWGFNDDGVSVVCRDGLFGYMNFDGTWMLEPQYESVSTFGEEGFAIIRTGGKYGMIDKTGGFLIEPVWEDIHASYNCEVSQFETWEYTEEAYHAVDGERVCYFDIADGAVAPPLP